MSQRTPSMIVFYFFRTHLQVFSGDVGHYLILFRSWRVFVWLIMVVSVVISKVELLSKFTKYTSVLFLFLTPFTLNTKQLDLTLKYLLAFSHRSTYFHNNDLLRELRDLALVEVFKIGIKRFPPL